MLAEQAGLDRKSAGRVLVATIAANVDDIGSTTTTPWRVMSWEIRQDVAPHLVDGEITELRADLDDALAIIDQLRARLEAARTKLN
jgi:cobalamin-dependent methionine synthase I